MRKDLSERESLLQLIDSEIYHWSEPGRLTDDERAAVVGVLQALMAMVRRGEHASFDQKTWFKGLRAGDRVAFYREGTIKQFVGMKPYLRWDDGELDVVPGEFIVPVGEK